VIIQRVNRINPEKVFIIVRNDDAVAFVAGGVIGFKFDGTRDGLDAELADSITDNPLIAGVADEATAAGSYGLVQIYGVRTDAVIWRTDTAVVVGDALIVTQGSAALMRIAAGVASAYLPAFAAGEALASTNGAKTDTTTVFIRCM